MRKYPKFKAVLVRIHYAEKAMNVVAVWFATKGTMFADHHLDKTRYVYGTTFVCIIDRILFTFDNMECKTNEPLAIVQKSSTHPQGRITDGGSYGGAAASKLIRTEDGDRRR